MVEPPRQYVIARPCNRRRLITLAQRLGKKCGTLPLHKHVIRGRRRCLPSRPPPRVASRRLACPWEAITQCIAPAMLVGPRAPCPVRHGVPLPSGYFRKGQHIHFMGEISSADLADIHPFQIKKSSNFGNSRFFCSWSFQNNLSLQDT